MTRFRTFPIITAVAGLILGAATLGFALTSDSPVTGKAASTLPVRAIAPLLAADDAPGVPPRAAIQSASLLRIGPVTGGSGIVTVVIYNSDRTNSVGPIEITVAITRSGVSYSQTGALTFDPFTGDPRDNGHNFQLARPPGAGVGTINVIYQGTVVTSAQDLLP